MRALSCTYILRSLLIAVFCFLPDLSVHADVRLPRIFGNHMVLQRGMKLPVWGWAGAGESITVKLTGKELDLKVDATVDGGGRWKLQLPVLEAGGPYVMTVLGSSTITLNNVMVGEVWLCSGQSNMEVSMSPGASWWKGVINYKKELAAAGIPKLRLFKVHTNWQRGPIDDVNGAWAVSSQASAAGFSGTAFFFGRKLVKDLDVPVGLIAAAVGGMPIEQFSPYSGQAFWYNGMIHGVIPFGIRGATWYQGETNFWGGDRANYFDKQKGLIDAWRRNWGQGDFPFYLVQLAPGLGGPLPLFWEAQARALTVKNTGLATTNDLGGDLTPQPPSRDRGDVVHPRDKRGVGERLALLALARDYKQDVVCRGPVFKSMKVEKGKIRVSFDNAGSGLKSRDKKPLDSFEIAGEGNYFPAKAVIDGDSVLVSSTEVPSPSMVRFGWHHASNSNLQNKEGLPAFPFRTGSNPPTISGKRLFSTLSSITVVSTEGAGAIHYSLDGSPPDKQSPLYAHSINVDKTTTIRARFYRSDGVASNVAEATFVKAKPQKYRGKVLDLGVSYKYFETTNPLATLPRISSLRSPVKTGISEDFTLGVANRPDSYVLLFEGYLDVKEAGVYTFETTSDDGSALYVDKKLVVNNNGIHPPVKKTGKIKLRKGWRKVNVLYFESSGGEALSVQYSGPNIPLQALPCWCEQEVDEN